ncbi:MAG: DUF1934 domain-containing protein [Ruminococcaceae bacterium]|nr:DUF1934 domain-containing protein [Oscillospiraceae bacterium]
MLTKKNVMITMKTLRQGLSVSLFGRAEEPIEEEDLPVEEDREDYDPEFDAPEESEIMTEGYLIKTSNRIDLIYKEGELTGMEGSTTKIGFHPDYPTLVSMLRSGVVNTALVFEPQRRHHCVYNTPFSSFEVCVHTLEVRNDLPNGGELYLDYLIEIHGAKTERCKMTVTVR